MLIIELMPDAGLLSDHAKGDHLIAALLSAARAGDRAQVESLWSQLEALLLKHMAREELELLPEYSKENAVDAHRIVDQHTELRLELRDIRLSLDNADAEAFLRLVNRIHEHHATEEVGLYRWNTRRNRD